jgi:hypothetical protein
MLHHVIPFNSQGSTTATGFCDGTFLFPMSLARFFEKNTKKADHGPVKNICRKKIWAFPKNDGLLITRSSTLW